MANRLMRAWLARLTVVAAVLALPAIGAGAAQAAIAGAPHESTTNRPDLVSATILSSVSNAVDFCFDKTLQSTTGGGGFFLGGYRSTNALNSTSFALETTLSPPAGLPADSCIRANYPSGSDMKEFTIGTVAPGAGGVVTVNGGVPSVDSNNFPDSTPLTGSNTHNGTSGFTVGPDLAVVMPDPTTNTIAYFFDQQHSGAVIAPGNFYFVDAAGIVCFPTAVVAGAAGGNNFVTLSYAGDTCGESVSNAVRAGDLNGAVTSANDPTATNDDNSLPIVGTGATSRPDLTDVSMEADQSALDFTFDKTVTPNNAGAFFADLSNGTEVVGNNATVIATSTTSTTVRVTFPNYSTYDEYVIGGSVSGPGCAVRITALLSSCNIPAAAPLDAPFGNIGAFATGYTTGPDVLGAVGNTTTNVVQVALDQRAFHIGGGITLLDGTGNPIVTALGTSIQLPSQAAGPQTIDVTYSSGQVGLAQNLFVPAFALTSNTGTGTAGACFPVAQCFDQPTVNQIVALTKTSAILKAEAHAKHMSKALARRLARERKLAAKRAMERFLRMHHRSARL